MRARNNCIPCILKQGLNTVRLISDDPELHRKVLDEIMKRLIGVKLDRTPADHSNVAYRVVSELTGVKDPFYELKRKYNRIALGMYDTLKSIVERSEDRLHTAIKLAVAGNIIDLGIAHPFDLEKDIEEILRADFAIDDYGPFRESLAEAEKRPPGRILYIGDNAGEIVFDRVLVEELRGYDITFVVKSGPVINDALMEDALEVGIDGVANVIETGSDGIGIPLGEVSEEFMRHFKEADLIIAKGQGNFETLSEVSGNIFFLLKVKCEDVADELGVRFGDIVFARNRGIWGR